MAVVTKRIEPHRRLGLSSTPSIQAAQVASAAYKKGDPVYISASGYVTASPVASVSSHSAIDTAAGDITGFVQEDGANSASNTSKVGVTPALPGMMFKGQLIDTTTGALATVAQTDLGANMGLAKLSGDTHYGVDKGTASNRDCVQVLELIDAVGTSGGQVGFIVRDTWNTMRL